MAMCHYKILKKLTLKKPSISVGCSVSTFKTFVEFLLLIISFCTSPVYCRTCPRPPSEVWRQPGGPLSSPPQCSPAWSCCHNYWTSSPVSDTSPVTSLSSGSPQVTSSSCLLLSQFVMSLLVSYYLLHFLIFALLCVLFVCRNHNRTNI